MGEMMEPRKSEFTTLVIRRRRNEAFFVYKDDQVQCKVTFCDFDGSSAKIVINAPMELTIVREEVEYRKGGKP